MTMTEPNPMYWAPNMTKKSKILRKEGKYPPKLSNYEKRIVDRQGFHDAYGNRYSVTWTSDGHPIASKNRFGWRLI